MVVIFNILGSAFTSAFDFTSALAFASAFFYEIPIYRGCYLCKSLYSFNDLPIL